MLQVAYCPNFKGQDTLLLAGSREDIEFFRSVFVEWNGEELDLIDSLQKRGKVQLFSVATICLRRDTNWMGSFGQKRVDTSI